MDAATARRFERIETKADERHESNLSKFDALNQRVATISGQLKIIIGLLLASGAVNIYSTVKTK